MPNASLPAPGAPIRDLLLVAGSGDYPLQLAASARRQGVERLVVIAFRRETDRAIERLADRTDWLHLGQLARMRELIRAAAIPDAVLAGSLAPTSLFSLRPDRPALEALARIKERNAHTLFGAFVAELAALGVRVLPAYRFMEDAMPAPGPT